MQKANNGAFKMIKSTMGGLSECSVWPKCTAKKKKRGLRAANT